MSGKCEQCGVAKEQQDALHAVIEEYKGTQGALIPVLHEAQEIYGYLPFEVQLEIARELRVPLAEVYGVVSFYTQFSTNPKGKYKINVCLGTACYVKGAQEILDKFKQRLTINVGECTDDGLFSLDACRCVGACGLAPVVTINDDVYGRLTPDMVDDILAKYYQLENGGEADA